jgi:hypothetical protein
MLAPRIVHFAKHQMVWECATCWKFEASGITDEEVGSGQVRQEYRKDNIQRIINESFDKHSNASVDLGDQGEVAEPYGPNALKRLECWHQCVDTFSSRALTISTDKLPAISGLAAVFSDGILGGYHAGIWPRNLPLELAWSRVVHLLAKPVAYRAPSWSWASLDGSISHLSLHWPLDRLGDELTLAWMDQFGPRLLEQRMLLRDDTNPSIGVSEGSYIIVDASCKHFKTVVQQSGGFRDVTLNPILDQKDDFDCKHCQSGGVIAEARFAPTEDPLEHDHGCDQMLCMLVQGTAWRDPVVDVFCLLLQPIDAYGKTFERVGCLVITGGYNCVTETMTRFFDNINWERRSLKLM